MALPTPNATTNKVRKASAGGQPVAASLASPKTAGSNTASLTVATNWNDDTATDVIIYRKGTDSAGRPIATEQTAWVAVLTGTTLSGMVLREGTEPVAGYPADADTVVLCTPTASLLNDLADAWYEQHKENGTHADVITTNAINENTANNGVTVDGVLLKDGQVQMSGVPVQVKSTGYSAVATGTTILPVDDTIPQNTEGVEFMTQSITPKSATNILVIEADIMIAISSNGQIVGALFQDANVNALAAVSMYNGNFVNNTFMLRLSHTMVAGTTSATTFKVRCGSETAGTWTFNGASSNRRFGTTTKSTIKVTEYRP